MPTVSLRFSALPSHVRTARLVAAAVARRSGLDETLLDEVRLAVGEACSRAVELHRRHNPHEPVLVELTDSPGRFAVAVTDAGGTDGPPDVDALDELRDSLKPAVDSAGEPDGDIPVGLPAGMGLAVISGLVEDVTVVPQRSGLTIEMGWPLSAV